MKNFSSRSEVVEHLQKVYKGQYGKYKYYAGQTFVFKNGKTANKTLLVRDANEQISSKNLFIKVPEVYEGATKHELNKVIEGLKEETIWYTKEFGKIPGLKMPSEEYSICNDPMESGNKTVLISTEWIDAIQGDIFRIDSKKLHDYITNFPQFENTLVQFASRAVSLAIEGIFPDITGTDNVAIYIDKRIPKIALIDRHIISINKYSTNKTKAKIDGGIERLEKFLENPLDFNNVSYLSSGEFI
jgi:hypothetical protein